MEAGPKFYDEAVKGIPVALRAAGQQIAARDAGGG